MNLSFVEIVRFARTEAISGHQAICVVEDGGQFYRTIPELMKGLGDKVVVIIEANGNVKTQCIHHIRELERAGVLTSSPP